MGNSACCGQRDNAAMIDTGKEYEKFYLSNTKASIIQNTWRGKRQEKKLSKEESKSLNDALGTIGQFISTLEAERATPLEITILEQKLPSYSSSYTNQDTRLFIAKPFQYNSNDGIYHGFWNKEARREGYGTFLLKGKKYEGIWKDDQLLIGRIYERNGSYYEGEINSFEPNGEGVMVYANGDNFSGQWKDGVQNGRGVRKFADGCLIEGNFTNNTANGDGKFTWPDGSAYEGQFKNGSINGIGKYISINGDYYEGSWVLNLPDGEGTFRSADSNTLYVGEYKLGKKNGKGLIRWAHLNKIYDGEWTNNFPNGIGEFRNANDRSKGLWRYGKLISTENGETLQNEVTIPEHKENFKSKDDFNHLEGGKRKTKTFKAIKSDLITTFVKQSIEKMTN